MIERIRGAIPLGRWGEPEDIARGVAFLCSPEAGWMTGEVMRDGRSNSGSENSSTRG
ncbi:MAG: SDR family oxidoreductase, partial [Planctomycetaceae bacterium]